MSTTITTATVTTITSVTSTLSGLTDALGLVAVLTFLALLIQKEMLSTASSRLPRAFGRGLNIAIVPLSLAFAMIAGALLLQALVNPGSPTLLPVFLQ